jgi:hypothetical protein
MIKHNFNDNDTFFQHFESSGINLMSDSQYNGQTRVQVLLEYLQEREMDLEDLGSVRRIKLEQCIQLCQFETDANQVNKISIFISLIFYHSGCFFGTERK